jgi:hypothetical protein
MIAPLERAARMAGVDRIQHDRDGRNTMTLPPCFCALRAPPLIWINPPLSSGARGRTSPTQPFDAHLHRVPDSHLRA